MSGPRQIYPGMEDDIARYRKQLAEEEKDPDSSPEKQTWLRKEIEELKQLRRGKR